MVLSTAAVMHLLLRVPVLARGIEHAFAGGIEHAFAADSIWFVLSVCTAAPENWKGSIHYALLESTDLSRTRILQRRAR